MDLFKLALYEACRLQRAFASLAHIAHCLFEYFLFFRPNVFVAAGEHCNLVAKISLSNPALLLGSCPTAYYLRLFQFMLFHFERCQQPNFQSFKPSNLQVASD